MPQQLPELPSDLASEARANDILLRSRVLAQERWLTSEEVSALMHTEVDPDPMAYTRDLRSRGLLMGAEYRKRCWYPAFQFDAAGDASASPAGANRATAEIRQLLGRHVLDVSADTPPRLPAAD